MKYKNPYKKISALALTTAMITTYALPVMAADGSAGVAKEENVYANLSEDGTVENIYVVNSYYLDSDTEIVDYGTYTSTRNLTSESAITVDGDTVQTEAEKGKFNYQGDLESKELPWKIDVSYTLDGEKTAAEDLAGKSGALEITLQVKQNEKIADTFFSNYLLQAAVTLDTAQCDNIVAKGATTANSGDDKQLLYNIMAGQEKTLVITADVKDFEMDAITFKGVPMSFDVDADSLDLSALTDKTDDIHEATVDLNDGAGKLQDGTNELQEGVLQYTQGVDTLYAGADTLLNGISSLNTGVDTYTSGVSQIALGTNELASKTENLPTLMTQLTGAVAQLDSGSADLADEAVWTQIEQGFTQVEQGLAQMKTGLSDMDTQALTPMLAALGEGGSIRTGMQSLETGIAGANNYVTALNSISEGYTAQMASVQAILAQTGQVQQQSYDPTGDLTALYQSMAASSAALNGVLNGDGTKPGLGAALNGCNEGAQALDAALFSADNSVYGVLSTLQTKITAQDGLIAGVDKLSAGIETLEQVLYKKEGQSIKAGAQSLNTGLSTLNGSTGTLAESSSQLVTGITALQSGSNQLAAQNGTLTGGTAALLAGADSLNSGAGILAGKSTELLSGTDSLTTGVFDLKTGTQDFSDETADLDEQITDGVQDKLDEFSGKDYEPVSFVSEKNTKVSAVQFVMKTQAITIPEEEIVEEQDVTPTFLEKLKQLIMKN